MLISCLLEVLIPWQRGVTDDYGGDTYSRGQETFYPSSFQQKSSSKDIRRQRALNIRFMPKTFSIVLVLMQIVFMIEVRAGGCCSYYDYYGRY